MAADPLDVLTLSEAYRAINDAPGGDRGTGNHDEELSQHVTAISRRLDELVGPIVQRTVTEYHDGCAVIMPRQTPVASVTTLTEYDGSTSTVLTAETWGTSPTDAYILDTDTSEPHYGRIVRRSGGSDSWFPGGSRTVELVYVAGRAADTASVDARFKRTAASILNAVWTRDAGSWTRAGDPFDPTSGPVGFFDAVTRRVAEMLADQRVPPGIA